MHAGFDSMYGLIPCTYMFGLLLFGLHVWSYTMRLYVWSSPLWSTCMVLYHAPICLVFPSLVYMHGLIPCTYMFGLPLFGLHVWGQFKVG